MSYLGIHRESISGQCDTALSNSDGDATAASGGNAQSGYSALAGGSHCAGNCSQTVMHLIGQLGEAQRSGSSSEQFSHTEPQSRSPQKGGYGNCSVNSTALYSPHGEEENVDRAAFQFGQTRWGLFWHSLFSRGIKGRRQFVGAWVGGLPATALTILF